MLRTAVNQVFRPLGGDLTAELPLLFDRKNRDNLRVIVDPDSGSVLAHAAFVGREAWVLGRKVRIACVGAVFTAEQCRRHGLASRVLADALARARPERDLILASGDRGLYRREAMELVPPMARFVLPTGTSAAAADFEMWHLPPPATPADHDDLGNEETQDQRLEVTRALGTMADLYAAEPVHFVRSPIDWRRLWQAGRLVDRPATFTRLARGGRTVAYVLAQNGGRRTDGSVRPRRILEFAGDRDTILDAAPTLAEELLIPSYDTSTVNLGQSRGWPLTTRQFPITAQTLTIAATVIPWYGLNYV